jgi:hypothetical protein
MTGGRANGDCSLMARGVPRALLELVLLFAGRNLGSMPRQSFAPQPAGVSVWVVLMVLSLIGVIGVLVVLLVVIPPVGPPAYG